MRSRRWSRVEDVLVVISAERHHHDNHKHAPVWMKSRTYGWHHTSADVKLPPYAQFCVFFFSVLLKVKLWSRLLPHFGLLWMCVQGVSEHFWTGCIKASRVKLELGDPPHPVFDLLLCFAASDRLGRLPACPHTDDCALYSAGPELCCRQTHAPLRFQIRAFLRIYRLTAMLVQLCAHWGALMHSQRMSQCWINFSMEWTQICTGELCLGQVCLQAHGRQHKEAFRCNAVSRTDSCFLTSVHLHGRMGETEADRADWWLHFRHQRIQQRSKKSSSRRGESGAIRWTAQGNRNMWSHHTLRGRRMPSSLSGYKVWVLQTAVRRAPSPQTTSSGCLYPDAGG